MAMALGPISISRELQNSVSHLLWAPQFALLLFIGRAAVTLHHALAKDNKNTPQGPSGGGQFHYTPDADV
jgi:hypothetical protein